MILYRPVGLEEMGLIFDSGCKSFPPRLSHQPIFYPVLNLEYATQIARDWNTKSDEFAGFVTQFEIDENTAKKYKPQTVGNSSHQELWIPAEELAEFNKAITNKIKIVSAYFGEKFKGMVPNNLSNLSSKDVIQQLACLDRILNYNPIDFMIEISINKKAVYLNFPFWLSRDFLDFGFSTNEQKEEILNFIQKIWSQVSPECMLFVNS